MKEVLEESNPVDLIIFPERCEKQKGRCIGSPSETDDLTCKYTIKSEPIKTEPGMNLLNIKYLNAYRQLYFQQNKNTILTQNIII